MSPEQRQAILRYHAEDKSSTIDLLKPVKMAGAFIFGLIYRWSDGKDPDDSESSRGVPYSVEEAQIILDNDMRGEIDIGDAERARLKKIAGYH